MVAGRKRGVRAKGLGGVGRRAGWRLGEGTLSSFDPLTEEMPTRWAPLARA